ncbi:glutathione S-transferase family protein [Microbulbifer sp. YPW16]|uniref:glutathione S-transferase family protein n=1 Tax=Microbulbifer sp. YPW16 TaxID=2904242 RepID=UPI001E5EBA33|nr:glutathione S-transferase family protein [Microbulbifer sp. YPW16]UHQ53976.1 glutathione S-transferase family protein [Microbulbifer sp. YPW16]
MTDQLVFYTNPQSRGRIVRWMLEEIGQPYKVEVVEYGAGMKSATFHAINPMGKVPVVVHNGQVVTETAAICAYLAEAYPEAGLAPTREERAAYYRWLFFTAGPIEAALTNRSIFGGDPAPEKQRMAGYGNYGLALDALSRGVTDNPYIAGKRFTAADVYVGAQVGWGLQFGTIEKRQEFIDYFARVSDRKAFRRATELDEALAAETSDA